VRYLNETRARSLRGSSPRCNARSGQSGWGTLFLLAIILCLAYLLWKSQGRLDAPGPSARPEAPIDRSPAQIPPSCGDPFPLPDASYSLVDPGSGAGAISVTRIVNDTEVDRMVDLTVGNEVRMSIAAPAAATSTVRVPVGAYGWRIRDGAAWCNSSRTFVRERRTFVTDGLQIVASSELTIHIEPDPKKPAGFGLRTSDRPVIRDAASPATGRTEPKTAGSVLILPRGPNGQFEADGEIDGARVRFMIDTGATSVAIPTALAQQLGYYQGRPVLSRTANGTIAGYEFPVRRLAFGPFSVENVPVVALPNLEIPLLGMSLLQAFDIQQTPASMRVTNVR
jgi:aspartyl protease family protein